MKISSYLPSNTIIFQELIRKSQIIWPWDSNVWHMRGYQEVGQDFDACKIDQFIKTDPRVLLQNAMRPDSCRETCSYSTEEREVAWY